MIQVVIYSAGENRSFEEYPVVLYGNLMGLLVYKDVYSDDPVFSGRYVYEDGGWRYCGKSPKIPHPVDKDNNSVPPECASCCKWRQTAHLDNQRNALRVETVTLIDTIRCGWNLKPLKLGGHALDYAPCLYER